MSGTEETAREGDGTTQDKVRQFMLASADAVPREIRDDWSRYVGTVISDRMWARPTLSRRDRSFATVAAVATLRCPSELRTQVRVALEHGISRRELCELMLQVSGYAGFAVGLEGMHALRAIFDAEPDPPSDAAEPKAEDTSSVPPDELLARGRALLADLRPDTGNGSPPIPERFAPDWRRWLIGFAFGDLWRRPGLTLVERERITLAVLVALGREAELRSHVLISTNLGISPEEIGEEVMHLAAYVGFPSCVDAMRVASEFLRNQEEGQA